ncbi:kinase-like protein [Rhizophagus irregularis]|nr:kinase-like protein [Rhizophagus irregularis]
MEFTNINNENSFDPTPKLKSSPIPIKFVSFNHEDIKCINCGENYIKAHFYWQYYCKKCLISYLNEVTDNNLYLDVYYTMKVKCDEHEISQIKVPKTNQECCGNCLIISYFRQISTYNYQMIESEKDCVLCGKSLYQGNDKKITRQCKLCSDCYLISSEYIESTLVKKKIFILYLPWWHVDFWCKNCLSELIFTSDCQKYCEHCLIFYVGCRYCLTTNIVFGLTGQTQCKKCKRISLVKNGDRELDDFLLNSNIYDNLKLSEFMNTVKSIDKYFDPLSLFNSIFEKKSIIEPIKWIPYSQFTNVKEMTRGGFGIIYQATWLSNNETVILKRFEDSKNIDKYFLNELKSFQYCFGLDNEHIIKPYGFTKDAELEDYILVMKYAAEGDLHKYLQNNFAKITWDKQKLDILWQISKGLETIHNKDFMHRDFHSGNILFDCSSDEEWEDNNYFQWKITDLGLSHSVNNKSSNNEIYGVIPYIAPEIFKGSKFSKETDIYSFGMIMWELTTGCKPFANVEHSISLIFKILDGERPKITEDTPECYANLMKSCWHSDPQKRPSIKKIRFTIGNWIFKNKNNEVFNQAEEKRIELVKLKKIGPEFTENRHSEAIYTSRLLSALISKCASTNSSSSISFDNKNDYNHDYISAEQELDIDLKSSMIQNSSTSLKKRSNEVFLNTEIHDNGGKCLL